MEWVTGHSSTDAGPTPDPLRCTDKQRMHDVTE